MGDNPSALVAAALWLQGLLTGTLGTSLAVLAIAWIGLALMQGRLAARDGIKVVIGCFVLFAAPILARTFLDFAEGAHSPGPSVARAAPPAPVVTPSAPPQFDPYAGASVPR